MSVVKAALLLRAKLLLFRAIAYFAGSPKLLSLTAEYAKLSCAPASSPLNWRTRMRIIPIILAVAALVLSGCNANQEVNLSSHRAAPGVVAGPYFPDYNPYDPVSYAQNHTGWGGR
jgi:hypothetical protein